MIPWGPIYTSQQFLDRSMRSHSATADIAYCLAVPAAAPTHTHLPLRGIDGCVALALIQYDTFETHTFLFQIMVTSLS